MSDVLVIGLGVPLIVVLLVVVLVLASSPELRD